MPGPQSFGAKGELPQGTTSYQLELGPSGHLLWPCCEYSGRVDRNALTMMVDSVNEPEVEETSQSTSQSSTAQVVGHPPQGTYLGEMPTYPAPNITSQSQPQN